MIFVSDWLGGAERSLQTCRAIFTRLLSALSYMDMTIRSFAPEARTHRIGGHYSSMPMKVYP